MEQRKLDESALQAFYHDGFVEDQLRDFSTLTYEGPLNGTVVDIGGGCGFFASGLVSRHGLKVRVLDMDPKSVEKCKSLGIEAEIADACSPNIRGDESAVCFNLILHHMVSDSETTTRALQQRVMQVWKDRVVGVFVNEYIYESFFGNLSGWLIYQITKSKFLSAIGKFISRIFPSFRANTFGIGVRFRSHKEWIKIFETMGFEVKRVSIGRSELVALPLRILMIKDIRRDSFWLEPKSN